MSGRPVTVASHMRTTMPPGTIHVTITGAASLPQIAYGVGPDGQLWLWHDGGYNLTVQAFGAES